MGLASCKPKLKYDKLSSGDINPKNFVAIGGNGISGYADGALHVDAQKIYYSHRRRSSLGMVCGAHRRNDFVQGLLFQAAHFFIQGKNYFNLESRGIQTCFSDYF